MTHRFLASRHKFFYLHIMLRKCLIYLSLLKETVVSEWRISNGSDSSECLTKIFAIISLHLKQLKITFERMPNELPFVTIQTIRENELWRRRRGETRILNIDKMKIVSYKRYICRIPNDLMEFVHYMSFWVLNFGKFVDMKNII